MSTLPETGGRGFRDSFLWISHASSSFCYVARQSQTVTLQTSSHDLHHRISKPYQKLHEILLCTHLYPATFQHLKPPKQTSPLFETAPPSAPEIIGSDSISRPFTQFVRTGLSPIGRRSNPRLHAQKNQSHYSTPSRVSWPGTTTPSPALMEGSGWFRYGKGYLICFSLPLSLFILLQCFSARLFHPSTHVPV